MNRKRILYLGNALSSHGLNPTTIETLSKRLSLDLEITLASSKLNKFFRLLDMWRSIWKNRKLVDVVLIDTYSSAAFLYAWSSGMICEILQMPYVAFLHGGDLPKRFANSTSVSKRYISNAALVVSPSGYLKDAVMGFFKKESEVIPNYLDLHNYSFKQRGEKSDIRILWVRSFHEIYQPLLAIQVVAELRKKGHNAELAMVGPDKDGTLQESKALVNKLNLEEFVEFTGLLTKADWIEKSTEFNVFLNSTSIDNTPVSVMEAMALGMPVVTTKVGGIPFLFEDGVEGIMVEEQTPQALAEAIFSLCENPAKTEAISKAARKKAEEWDWPVVREQWLELFNSIK